MSEAAVLVEQPRDRVVRVTINDPGRRNPLSIAVFNAIRAAVESVPAGTGVVVLTGAGDSVFASGADLSELGSGAATGLGGDFGVAMEAAQTAIEACPVPVVARIQGHCLGAGYQLALACDLRVAVDDARLGVPASRFGLLPPHVHHSRMIQQLGPQTTRLLMLTGRSFSGAEALAHGLAEIVCPREELDGTVDALCDDILGGAPLTVRNSKRIINTLLELDALGRELDPATAGELTRLSMEAHDSDDVREGLSAFFERRRPNFKGR